MSSTERTLHALRLQAQFQLVEASTECAHALAVSRHLQNQVEALSERGEMVAHELRALMHRESINPALLSSLRDLHRTAQGGLLDASLRLAVAQGSEEVSRDRLAAARHLDRSLEKGQQLERLRHHRFQQSREGRQADDLWLQFNRRVPP